MRLRRAILSSPLIAASLAAVSASAQETTDVEETPAPKSNTTESDESTFEILRSYPLKHCIVSECWPRGTLQLGQNGARIDDDKVFTEMKDSDTLRQKLAAAPIGSFYTISLEEGKEGNTLDTSVPVSLIKNTEDLHDSLEVSLTDASGDSSSDPGDVIGINYRFTKSWGLNLFEHTTVRLLRTLAAPEIRLPPKVAHRRPPPEPKFRADGTAAPPQQLAEDGGEQQPEGVMALVRKYWWVIMLGMLAMQFLGAEEEPARPAKSGGGGGGAAAKKKAQ